MKSFKRFIRILRHKIKNKVSFRRSKTDFYPSKRAIGKVIIWVSLVFPVLATLYLFIPNTTDNVVPGFTSFCDCGELIPLRLEVTEEKTIRLHFSVGFCKDKDWTYISIQRPNNASDFRIEDNYVNTDTLPKSTKDLIFHDNGKNGSYLKLSKTVLEKYLPELNKSGTMIISYTLSDGLKKRNYSSYFIAFTYIPVKLGDTSDKNESIELELKTPHSYIITQSIPDIEKVVFTEEGIFYTLNVKRAQSGILINLDDISQSASKEIYLLIISSVFGFSLGYFLEKIIVKTFDVH